MTAGTQHLRNVKLGMLLYLLSVIIFSMTDCLNRLAVQHSSFFSFTFIRASMATILLLAIFVPKHGWASLKPKNPWPVALLSISVTCTFYGYTYVFSHMPMAEAYAIGYIYPLVAILISIPLLGDRVHWPHGLAALVGFMGVLSVFLPAIDTDAHVTWVWGLCLLVNISYGVYLVLSGWLAKVESKTVMMLAGNIISVFVSAVVLLVFGGFTVPDATGWGLITAIVIGGVCARYLVLWGLQLASASSVSPFDYLSMGFVALFSWFLYAEVPGVTTWVGAGIVAVACLFIYRTPQYVQHGVRPGLLPKLEAGPVSVTRPAPPAENDV